MTNFEITGSHIVGGKDEHHNQALLRKVHNLEGFIQSIGKALGMASLDSAFVKTEEDGYGFRFASTSQEKFDVKGVQLDKCEFTSELVDKL